LRSCAFSPGRSAEALDRTLSHALNGQVFALNVLAAAELVEADLNVALGQTLFLSAVFRGILFFM